MPTLRLTRFRTPSFLRTGQQASATAGRNHNGRITVRHRGAGHSRSIRSIRWAAPRTSSLLIGYTYDPRRRGRLARLLHPPRSSSTPFSLVLAAQGRERLSPIAASSEVSTALGEKRPLRPGERAALARFEVGDFLHAVSLSSGQAPTVARAPGAYAQVRAREREGPQTRRRAVLRLPSGQRRTFSQQAEASAGRVARVAGTIERPTSAAAFSDLDSAFPASTQLRGKAGRSR